MKAIGLPQNLIKPFDFGPEVVRINAQFEQIPTTLDLTLEFSLKQAYFVASVRFSNVEGFRVLEEGDLLKFWGNGNFANYPRETWLWQVLSEGWFADEKRNNNLTMLRTIEDQLTEYLVTGEAMCVSVICKGSQLPVVSIPEA